MSIETIIVPSIFGTLLLLIIFVSTILYCCKLRSQERAELERAASAVSENLPSQLYYEQQLIQEQERRNMVELEMIEKLQAENQQSLKMRTGSGSEASHGKKGKKKRKLRAKKDKNRREEEKRKLMDDMRQDTKVSGGEIGLGRRQPSRKQMVGHANEETKLMPTFIASSDPTWPTFGPPHVRFHMSPLSISNQYSSHPEETEEISPTTTSISTEDEYDEEEEESEEDVDLTASEDDSSADETLDEPPAPRRRLSIQSSRSSSLRQEHSTSMSSSSERAYASHQLQTLAESSSSHSIGGEKPPQRVVVIRAAETHHHHENQWNPSPSFHHPLALSHQQATTYPYLRPPQPRYPRASYGPSYSVSHSPASQGTNPFLSHEPHGHYGSHGSAHHYLHSPGRSASFASSHSTAYHSPPLAEAPLSRSVNHSPTPAPFSPSLPSQHHIFRPSSSFSKPVRERPRPSPSTTAAIAVPVNEERPDVSDISVTMTPPSNILKGPLQSSPPINVSQSSSPDYSDNILGEGGESSDPNWFGHPLLRTYDDTPHHQKRTTSPRHHDSPRHVSRSLSMNSPPIDRNIDAHQKTAFTAHLQPPDLSLSASQYEEDATAQFPPATADTSPLQELSAEDSQTADLFGSSASVAGSSSQ